LDIAWLIELLIIGSVYPKKKLDSRFSTLSESMPKTLNGSFSETFSSALRNTYACPLPITARVSTQLDKISVRLSEKINSP